MKGIGGFVGDIQNRAQAVAVVGCKTTRAKADVLDQRRMDKTHAFLLPTAR